MNQTEIRELLREFELHDAKWQLTRQMQDVEQIKLLVAEFKQLCEKSKHKPHKSER